MLLIEKFTRLMTMVLVVIGFVAATLMMLHIVADVFMRSTFDIAVPATERIVTRYYMVALALLPLGWVEWSKSMIAVDAFSFMYGKLGDQIVSLLGTVLSAVIYGVLGSATWTQAMEQYKLGSYIMSLNLVIPLWPTYFIVPVAFFMAMFVCLVRIPSIFLPNRSAAEL